MQRTVAIGQAGYDIVIAGADLASVHAIRTIADIDALKVDLSPGTRAVIVGGGYIGLETQERLLAGSVQAEGTPSQQQMQRVFDIDAQIAHRRVDLGVAQQDLHSPQGAGLLKDESSLGSSQGMGTIILSTQSDPDHSLLDQARILAGPDWCRRHRRHCDPGAGSLGL